MLCTVQSRSATQIEPNAVKFCRKGGVFGRMASVRDSDKVFAFGGFVHESRAILGPAVGYEDLGFAPSGPFL